MFLLSKRTKSRLWIAILPAVLAACGGGGDASQQPVPLTPAGANSAPSIQGQPGAKAVTNQRYSFAPTATDANGDALTFSATNLPSWASINANTGQITGTPGSADVGTYDGIVVTVSDGHSSVALPSFSITVTEVTGGAATLSWMPPTENTDGSALTDLAGFQVVYGTSPDNLDQSITLSNPSLSSYVIENLAPGTWYFSVVALNANGVPSPLANIASKTIS